MTTRPDYAIRHLAALAVASALCACGRSEILPSDKSSNVPVADVENSDLPTTLDPVVVEGPDEPLDWTVAEDDSAAPEVAADAAESRSAALRYMTRDGEALAAQPTPGTRAAPAPAREPVSVPAPRPSPRAPDAAPAESAAAPRIAAAAPAPAAERTTGDARKLNQQAIALINAGQPERAIPALERAIAEQPRDPEMLGNLGYAYMLTGDHSRARTHLRRALDIAPTRSATWLNLGQTYAELGQPDVAVDAVVTGYRYSTRKPSVRSALQRAATGERHSAAWREAAGMALERINS